MSIPDGKKPDLIFYYSLALPSTTINKNKIGTDTIQTAHGIIFADKTLKIPIGSFAFNITIFETNKKNRSLLYDGTGTNVYFLPEGTISNSVNLKFQKTPSGIFVVPPSLVKVYQILSGSEDFLNSRGFIVQLTNNLDLTREMLVYFES
jgi:hypothetical protein